MKKQQEEPRNIGIKIGSMNTAIAYRKEDGTIDPKVDKTCIRYPDSFIKKSTDAPIIGEKATQFDDAMYPLRLGVVKTDEGIQQTADILRYMGLLETGRIVLASPAVQMKDGNDRLARAIRMVCKPHNGKILAFSEGLCSAVSLATEHVKTVKDSTFFSLNLGSTTLEIGAFRGGNQKHLSAHSEVSGNRVDARIRTLVTNTLGDAIVTDWAIRNRKESANLINPTPFEFDAMTNNGIKHVEVLDEVIHPIEDYTKSVATIFCDEVFGSVEPAVRNMALKSPLYISGGMANIAGVPERIIDMIEQKMNIRFDLACSKEGNSHIAPAKGALMLAEAIAEEEGNGGE